MKLVIFAFVIVSVFAVHSSKVSFTRQTITTIKEVAKNNLTIEWGTKLGAQFTKIAKVSKFFAKFGGPIGEFLILGLMIFDNPPQDDTKEHLKNITNQLDGLSKQIAQLDAKLIHSVQKIVAEVKFQNFVNYFIELRASKQNFESIIASFASNSTLFIHKLDHFIQQFSDNSYDVKLVDVLDFKVGTYNSIIDDLITLSRSYHEGNKDGNSKLPQTSTMQNIFDIYISILMDIMKASVIQESAVNIKTTLTGYNYEEDRRRNHYRTNEIMKSFFGSIKKTINKLNDNDLEVAIDFSVNGDTAPVRMINVLQMYWDYETHLSLSNTCYYDCFHYQNWYYNISYVMSCKGQASSCDICKCTCDQIFNNKTIRKVYTGRIEAPEGYAVTGIKFIEFNKAIYPQIEVGKLLPMAMIDQDSVFWLDNPTDDDFFTFNFDNREMSFGDSRTNQFLDSVVTGVQFEKKSSGVAWTIYGRELDFNIGILGQEQLMQSYDTAKTFDMFGKIAGLSSSTKFTIRNVTKITFSTSNEHDDFGQSFVPYFDGNEITMDNKAPLSGIGLIQYTNDWKYAGYIRPVIRGLDYRTYFSTSYETDEYILANFTELIEAKSKKIKKMLSTEN